MKRYRIVKSWGRYIAQVRFMWTWSNAFMFGKTFDFAEDAEIAIRNLEKARGKGNEVVKELKL